jgi:hypothetical protein
MKLNKSIIRNLIKESIDKLLSEETMAQQRDNAITQISNILIRLEQTNINAQDVLNAAKEAYEAGKPQGETEMTTANRKEKKWSDADHDKQEKIAQGLAKDNPDMPKDEKMAIAGAQVNREKRKRNK